MAFGERFETDFLSQGEDENRSIAETLDIGWRTLATLPREELVRVSPATLAAHLPAGDGGISREAPHG
jgi:V/A-type H+-transporting ATPase subunit B